MPCKPSHPPSDCGQNGRLGTSRSRASTNGQMQASHLKMGDYTPGRAAEELADELRYSSRVCEPAQTPARTCWLPSVPRRGAVRVASIAWFFNILHEARLLKEHRVKKRTDRNDAGCCRVAIVGHLTILRSPSPGPDARRMSELVKEREEKRKLLFLMRHSQVSRTAHRKRPSAE